MSDLLSDPPEQHRPRGLLSEARLASEVLDELSIWLRDSQKSDADSAGLLFGTVTEGVANVEALTPVPLQKATEGGTTIGERLAKALDKSKLLRDSASPQLIGWCCVRPIDDLRQLGPELAFHNRRFRRSTDLLLVLRGRRAQILSAQLYARSCNLPLSVEHHRAAPVNLPDEILPTDSIPAIPPPATDGDLYLSAYEVGNEVPPADEFRKEVAAVDIPRPPRRSPSKALAKLRQKLASEIASVWSSITRFSSGVQPLFTEWALRWIAAAKVRKVLPVVLVAFALAAAGAIVVLTRSSKIFSQAPVTIEAAGPPQANPPVSPQSSKPVVKEVAVAAKTVPAEHQQLSLPNSQVSVQSDSSALMAKRPASRAITTRSETAKPHAQTPAAAVSSVQSSAVRWQRLANLRTASTGKNSATQYGGWPFTARRDYARRD